MPSQKDPGVGRLKFSGELKIPKNVKEDFFLQKIFPFFKAPLTRVSTLKGVDIAVAVAPVFSLVSESGEINMPRKQPKHALHVTVLSITHRIF